MDKNQYHFLGLITLFFVVASCSPKSEKAERPPNIVLIVADDLGYGDLSCYGQEKFETPNIDQLAKSGMRFTQFYSGTSVCAPSRSSLMSGRHTGHSFIRGNKEVQPEGQQAIADSVYTIAENLQEAGYTTGAFGKWGLGFVGTEGDPLNQGFDRFYGYNCQRQSHRYYPGHLWDNDRRVVLEANENLNKKVIYAPELIQEQALAFMEENQDKPFFLFLPYTLPHAELEVPKDSLLEQYAGQFPEKPYKGKDYGPDAKPMGYTSQAQPHAVFAAMVTRLDRYVGQVMDRMKELGLDENTIVVFTSDNGPHQEGGADPAFFNSSGGLRGVKRDLYEGGIRVPFIVRWPGQVKAGSTNTHVGAFWDMYPTFAEVAGTQVKSYTDGISFLPSLRGEAQQAHEYLYWEFHEQGGRQAVRMGDWKAVHLQVKDPTASSLELYDLSKDPAEKNNVAAAYPEIVREMMQLMEKAHVESPLFPFITG